MKSSKTIIRVHSFKNGSFGDIQRPPISVFPCLKLVEDSYLYVAVKNSKCIVNSRFKMDRDAISKIDTKCLLL